MNFPIFFRGQACYWFLETKFNFFNLNMFEKVGNCKNTEFHIHHGHFPWKIGLFIAFMVFW